MGASIAEQVSVLGRNSMFGLLACALAAAWSAPAMAQARCMVTDPTGTPLNVRTSPWGKVIGTVPNGMVVRVIDSAKDDKGRPWVYVRAYEGGAPLGWVFREFVSCY